MLSSMSTSAAVTKWFWWISPKVLELASIFKVHHNVALSSLYILTGTDVITYFSPAANRIINQSINQNPWRPGVVGVPRQMLAAVTNFTIRKWHKRVYFVSCSGRDCSIMVRILYCYYYYFIYIIFYRFLALMTFGCRCTIKQTLTRTLWIDMLCEVMSELSIVCCHFPPANETLTPYHVVHILVANASKYSMDSHCVCRLKNVWHIDGLWPTICGFFLVKASPYHD